MPTNKSQKIVEVIEKQKIKGPNKILHFLFVIIVFTLGTLFVATVLTVKTEEFNKAIFGIKSIQTQNQRIVLVKKLALWFSLFIFGLSFSVMSLRILTISPSPFKEKDNLLISILNRMISNTIQQSLIFAGVYAALLFDGVDHVQVIGGAETLAFAGLFFFARVAYIIGFLLSFPLGIPTLRGFGFTINIIIIVLMISRLVQYNLIPTFKQAFVPIVDMIL